MAKRLTRTVFIDGTPYGPESVIPAAVAARITNPNVWGEGPAAPVSGVVEETAPAAPVFDEPPSDEWTVRELREFAKANSVVLGAAKEKPAILRVLAEHGHIEAPTADEAPKDAAADAEASDVVDTDS